MLRAILLLITVIACTSGRAQTSQAEVNLEKRFIEAKQEALIGKTEEAIAKFRELLEQGGATDAVYFELARLEHVADNIGAAVDAMQQAYRLNPDDVYLAYLAQLYEATGQYTEAAELYDQRARRAPDDSDYRMRQAEFLVRAGKEKEAISVLNALEKRTGVNPEVARAKHALYLSLDDPRRAARELEQLIEAFPEQLEYRHLLAGFYTMQGEEREARRVYEEILKIEPADVRAQLALRDTPDNGEKPTTAGTDDELMAIMRRPDVELDLKIGRLLPDVQRVAETGDRALADRLLPLTAELRRIHPDAAKAAAVEGDLYFHTDRMGEAATAYAAAVELDDTVYPVWEQLLAARYADQQMAELRRDAAAALDIFPNRPAVYVFYALGEAFRGSYGEAESLLSEAESMVNEESAAALGELQTALLVMRDGSDARDIATERLPGGEEGAVAFYLRQQAKPNLSELRAADHERNTNALLLELLAEASTEAGQDSAAEEYRKRARAAGSKTNF